MAASRVAPVALCLVFTLGACADDRSSTTASSTSATVATGSGSSTVAVTRPTSAATSTAVPTTVDAVPVPVIGVVARTGGGSGEVLLTWTQSPETDVVSYVVERATSTGG